jgi:hypothetical protein
VGELGRNPLKTLGFADGQPTGRRQLGLVVVGKGSEVTRRRRFLWRRGHVHDGERTFIEPGQFLGLRNAGPAHASLPSFDPVFRNLQPLGRVLLLEAK